IAKAEFGPPPHSKRSSSTGETDGASCIALPEPGSQGPIIPPARRGSAAARPCSLVCVQPVFGDQVWCALLRKHAYPVRPAREFVDRGGEAAASHFGARPENLISPGGHDHDLTGSGCRGLRKVEGQKEGP